MDEYISKQDVVEYLEGYLRSVSADDDKTLLFDRGQRRALTNAIQDILAVKTADVQPVKHGKWLPSDSYITTAYSTIHCQICSECGADLMEDDDYDYDFCPVCGAKMDGDSKC